MQGETKRWRAEHPAEFGERKVSLAYVSLIPAPGERGLVNGKSLLGLAVLQEGIHEVIPRIAVSTQGGAATLSSREFHRLRVLRRRFQSAGLRGPSVPCPR